MTDFREGQAVISRKSVRYGVQLSASLQDGLRGHEGTIVNLSIDGCAVITEIPLAPGSYWAVRMETGQPGRILEVELAVVRWSRETRCGMEFIKIRAEKKTDLDAFVTLLESPPPG